MVVFTHDGRRFETNCAVTESRAFGAAGHDADVLSHVLRSPTVIEATLGNHLKRLGRLMWVAAT